MRIATWNVNSLRARMPRVLAWLQQKRPEVCCLQETKCSPAQFAAEEFTKAGYEAAHHGNNHWNGVAILSRAGLHSVQRSFGNEVLDREPRIIAATCANTRIYSIYAPNGRALDDPHYQYKLQWFTALRDHLSEVLDDPNLPSGGLLLTGDFNVAPADFDVYDPVRWQGRTHVSPPERDALAKLTGLGLQDLARSHHPHTPLYTWWSYRRDMAATDRGLRIDLLLGCARVATRTQEVWVDREERITKGASDHAPLGADFADSPSPQTP